jgi:DUF1009 family protein
MQEQVERLGMIAGNGPLPLLVVEEALKQGLEVTVAAVKEETEPAIETLSQERVSVQWMGLGQLGKLIRVFQEDGVRRALMVGQVKHVRIFAPGSRSPFSQLKHLPDWRMLKLLNSLRKRDTASLIGAVIEELEKEGIQFLDSTLFLEHLLPAEGVLTEREPSPKEWADFEYGRPIALEIARMDLGQTIVVKDRAVVAVETMEGTDATIRRASELAGGERISVIKVSRPQQDMRFDLPVIGPRTLEVMKECAVSALAVDAGKTLIIDKPRVLESAGRAGLTVVGF